MYFSVPGEAFTIVWTNNRLKSLLEYLVLVGCSFDGVATSVAVDVFGLVEEAAGDGVDVDDVVVLLGRKVGSLYLPLYHLILLPLILIKLTNYLKALRIEHLQRKCLLLWQLK